MSDPRAAAKIDAIKAIYAAVNAPDWAAPNLDGLADVLRDLSWLPAGPVVLPVPEPAGPASDLTARDRAELERVLHNAATASAGTAHPIELQNPA